MCAVCCVGVFDMTLSVHALPRSPCMTWGLGRLTWRDLTNALWLQYGQRLEGRREDSVV